MTDKELLQLVLEVIVGGYKPHMPEFKKAIAALREAIAQPEQEPVYQYQMANGNWIDQAKESYDYNVRWGPAVVRVLYASPLKMQPVELRALAKRRIFDAIRSAYDIGYNDARYAQAVSGDSAPGYKGREIESDHGAALLRSLNTTLAQPVQPAEGDEMTEENKKLPKFPHHPEPHTYTWSELERKVIEAYGKDCFESGEDHPLRPPATRPENSQDWAGMDGATAFHLIERHSDNWSDAHMMMDEWRLANPFAQPVQPTAAWRPITTAPRDGTLVLLLVDFEENSLEDTPNSVRTIGHNNFDHDHENLWQFAGWCWTHDCYTQGVGVPTGWLPFTALAQPVQPVRSCGNDACGWVGQTDGMLGTIGPLCPDCGETTEPNIAQPVQPVPPNIIDSALKLSELMRGLEMHPTSANLEPGQLYLIGEAICEQAKLAQPVQPTVLWKPTEAAIAALKRFEETCSDGEGYDLPNITMHKLAAIGLVYKIRGTTYCTTDFGNSVLAETNITQLIQPATITDKDAFNGDNVIGDKP